MQPFARVHRERKSSVGLQQDGTGDGGTVRSAHPGKQYCAGPRREFAKRFQFGANHRVVLVRIDELTQARGLFAALQFQNLGSSGLQQLGRRRYPANPPRLFQS